MYIPVHVCIHMCMCLYVYLSMYVCSRMCTCVCMSACVHMQMLACVCVHLSVCMSVCLPVTDVDDAIMPCKAYTTTIICDQICKNRPL